MTRPGQTRNPDQHSWASSIAERIVERHGITRLPVDPIIIARADRITVVAKPPSTDGVSGMLLRHGNSFGIAYATNIDNVGFQNFSIAHELGHYHLPGHPQAVLGRGHRHESRAGYTSGDCYELEADHFAAALLMPRRLFEDAMRDAGFGLSAVEQLASLCRTSLTATAIRYAQTTSDPVAVVVSSGTCIEYCFMSDALRDVEGLGWIRKGQGISSNTLTFAFNRAADPILFGRRSEDACDLRDWFGGERELFATEEVVGLGRYGKTLTVLTAPDVQDQIEAQVEEQELTDLWTPRF